MRIEPRTPAEGDGPPAELRTFHEADWPASDAELGVNPDRAHTAGFRRLRKMDRWREARRDWTRQYGLGDDWFEEQERRAVTEALRRMGYRRKGIGFAWQYGFPSEWVITWRGMKAEASPATVERPGQPPPI